MARVVYDIFGLLDKNSKVARKIEISERGITLENAVFKLVGDLNNFDNIENKEKYKVIFNNLLFYNDVINYIEEKKVSLNLENFDFSEFKTKFISTFVYFRDLFPNLSRRLSLEYKRNYIKFYGLSFEVNDNILDFDYKEITISYTPRNKFVYTVTYSLVPEVAEKLYDATIKTIKELDDNEALYRMIVYLYVAKIYYDSYDEIYHDEIGKKYSYFLKKMLDEIENRYFGTFPSVIKHISSSVKPADTICSNLEKFIIHVFEYFYRSKNINALEKIKLMLSNVDSSRPDNTLIVDSFSGLLVNQDLIDEYNVFNALRLVNEDNVIVSKLLYHFYVYHNTPDYKEMLANLNGEQRKQS